MKRTVPERVKEFMGNKPKTARLSYYELKDILELNNDFDRIKTAFYFGYMRGYKTKKGGAE